MPGMGGMLPPGMSMGMLAPPPPPPPQPADDTPPNNTIYVSNLSERVPETELKRDLQDIFVQFGKVRIDEWCVCLFL